MTPTKKLLVLSKINSRRFFFQKHTLCRVAQCSTHGSRLLFFKCMVKCWEMCFSRVFWFFKGQVYIYWCLMISEIELTSFKKKWKILDAFFRFNKVYNILLIFVNKFEDFSRIQRSAPGGLVRAHVYDTEDLGSNSTSGTLTKYGFCLW